MPRPADTNVTVTVDTDLITETTKNSAVVFTDDREDPVAFIGHPENFVSKVDKNYKITWTAVAKNGTTPVFFEDVKKKPNGTDLMKDLGRGNGHNKFKAKIKDDASINSGDEEEYSIIIGLNGYEGITGENQFGALIYVGKQVAYMDNYQNNKWKKFPLAPFEIEGISGNNDYGIVAYGDSQLACIAKGDSSWTSMAAPPFPIKGLAGDKFNGPIICSGTQVAFLTSSTQTNWGTVPTAPFEIEGITATSNNDPIIYSETQVAYLINNEWTMLATAPFAIEGIASNNGSGPVIYAGSKVARMDISKNTWQTVTDAPIAIEGIAGNSEKGPIIFAAANVYYLVTYQPSPVWTKVTTEPLDPKIFKIDPKIILNPPQDR
jgi:hypothetical protein